MKRKILIIGGVILIILIGALLYFIFFTSLFSTKSKPLAKASGQYLYYNDIKSLISSGTSPADSIEMVNRFIENWSKKQTLLDRAEKENIFDKGGIESKIKDYRNTLIVYDFEEKYVKAHLDTIIKEEEVKDYYNSNYNSFSLRQNIVKAWFIKLPFNSPKQQEIKNLILSGKDKKKIESYCTQFALIYSLEDSLWKDFEEIIMGTPFQENPNKLQFLQSKFGEAKEGELIYLLKIFDFKTSGQGAPLVYVINQVKENIINKRKVELVQNLEKEIYEQAKKDKKIEIYVK